MNTTTEQIKERIIAIGQEFEAVDSKTRENELREELRTFDLKQWDGMLCKTKSGKVGRMWHRYFATWGVYFDDYRNFRWSRNYTTCTLGNLEFPLEEPTVDVETIDDIESDIRDLENQIWAKKREMAELQKVCHHKVDPDNFEETEETKLGAFTLNGDPVYIDEAYCEICGARVTS